MIKMKRILSGLLCLILCLSLFAGCTKDKPEQPIETEEATETEEVVDTEDIEQQDTEVPDTETSDGEDVSINDPDGDGEMLRREYEDLLNYSWKLPEAVDILDTSWDVEYQLSDGSTLSYHISFTGGSVYVQWDESVFSAPWTVVTANGVCKLKFNPETAKESTYCVLLSADHDSIYLSQDFENGVFRGDIPLSLMMERTYG